MANWQYARSIGRAQKTRASGLNKQKKPWNPNSSTVLRETLRNKEEGKVIGYAELPEAIFFHLYRNQWYKYFCGTARPTKRSAVKVVTSFAQAARPGGVFASRSETYQIRCTRPCRCGIARPARQNRHAPRNSPVQKTIRIASTDRSAPAGIRDKDRHFLAATADRCARRSARRARRG